MNDLEPFTINTPKTQETMVEYHNWLKRQRKQDKKDLKNIQMKIYCFKHRIVLYKKSIIREPDFRITYWHYINNDNFYEKFYLG